MTQSGPTALRLRNTSGAPAAIRLYSDLPLSWGHDGHGEDDPTVIAAAGTADEVGAL